MRDGTVWNQISSQLKANVCNLNPVIALKLDGNLNWLGEKKGKTGKHISCDSLPEYELSQSLQKVWNRNKSVKQTNKPVIFAVIQIQSEEWSLIHKWLDSF